MAEPVIDGLEGDDVDERRNEFRVRPARTVDLVLELDQPGAAAHRPGQIVEGCPLALATRVLSIESSMPAVVRGFAAITSSVGSVTRSVHGVGSRVSCFRVAVTRLRRPVAHV